MSRAEFVQQLPVVLRPNPARVVVRPFIPSVEPRDLNRLDQSRSQRIVDGVLAMSPVELAAEIHRVLADFSGRHRDVARMFKSRFAALDPALTESRHVTPDEALLIGSYFSHEYSYMAAALFNPSIVPHPDQTGAGHRTRAGRIERIVP